MSLEMDDSEGLHEVKAVAERNLSATEQRRQRKEVREDAEFSMILDFLEAFEDVLNLKSEFSINDLEDELINAAGNCDGPLQRVHVELLKGAMPFSQLPKENWHAALARLTSSYFHFDPSLNPLDSTPRGDEAAAYAKLSALDRCVLLRAVCEVRSERQDVRNIIELSSLSEKAQLKHHASKRKPQTQLPIYEPEDFSRHPIGEDEDERQYWLHDLRSRGFRLCRETLPTLSDAVPCTHRKKGKSKTVDIGEDVNGGTWETLACTLDAIDEVGAGLIRSKHKQDKKLGELLCKEAAEVRAEDEELRKNEAVARARQEKREMLLEAGRSRSLRERKKVDYTFTDSFSLLLEATQFHASQSGRRDRGAQGQAARASQPTPHQQPYRSNPAGRALRSNAATQLQVANPASGAEALAQSDAGALSDAVVISHSEASTEAVAPADAGKHSQGRLLQGHPSGDDISSPSDGGEDHLNGDLGKQKRKVEFEAGNEDGQLSHGDNKCKAEGVPTWGSKRHRVAMAEIPDVLLT